MSPPEVVLACPVCGSDDIVTAGGAPPMCREHAGKGARQALGVQPDIAPMCGWCQTVEVPMRGALCGECSGYPSATTVERQEAPRSESADEPPESSWWPVNLTAALAGTDIPPPILLERTDGERLLYAGRVHSFSGESETLKSWAAQQAVAEVLNRGEDVLYIDYEDDERGVVARLRALGVSGEAIKAHLVYVRPDEALLDRRGNPVPGATEAFDYLLSETYGLAVIDGVTEAMTVEGLELTDNADVARWARLLPKRLAAAGPPVIVVDHVPKATEAQGRYAIGGQHKLAGLTGAGFRFVTVRPLGRATHGEPVEGLVTITVTKDRPGHVRAFAADGKVGTLSVTSWPDGGVSIRLLPPGENEPDSRLVHRLLKYLETYDGSSKNAIESAVDGKAVAIREALAWMAHDDRAWVRVERKGTGHLHFLTDAGREVAK